MTQTSSATIKWVEKRPHSPRVLIIARVPNLESVGTDLDLTTGTYRSYVTIMRERDQSCFAWRNTVTGALVASLCERACAQKRPVEIEYSVTPWGWRLNHVVLVEEPPAVLPPAA